MQALSRPSCVLSLLLGGSLAIAQAPVVVVDDDGGPGVDYTLLHQALSAAADGSVILVKPGVYIGTNVVDGKSLVITADQEGDVRIDYRIFVKNLSASQAVVLRGLRIEGASSSSPSGIDISVNAGAVLVQSCVIRAGDSSFAANVFQSASVTFVDCDVLGGAVDVPFTNAALNAAHSNVTVYDSGFVGHVGQHTLGGKGGHGAILTGGTLFASGSTFQGGQGGWGELDPFSTCTFGGPGGHGLWFFENPQVFLLESVTAAGEGGPAMPPCSPGLPGVPVFGAGTVTSYLGEARSLAPLPPVELGQTATLAFDGKPGDLAFYALSLAQGHQFLPGLFGTLALALPIQVASAGVLPPAGTLQVQVQVPLLPAESLVAYLQGGFLNTSGAFFLGSPTAAIALAPQL